MYLEMSVRFDFCKHMDMACLWNCQLTLCMDLRWSEKWKELCEGRTAYHKFWHICCCWCNKFVSHELGLLARLFNVVESAFVCDGNDIWFVDMVDGLKGRALLACCKKSVSILKTAVWLFSCCSKSVVIGIKFWFAGGGFYLTRGVDRRKLIPFRVYLVVVFVWRLLSGCFSFLFFLMFCLFFL